MVNKYGRAARGKPTRRIIWLMAGRNLMVYLEHWFLDTRGLEQRYLTLLADM